MSLASEMFGICGSYCTHGGVCVLDGDHDGLHDSRYCKWSDSEAISKEQADELFDLEGTFKDIPSSIIEFVKTFT